MAHLADTIVFGDLTVTRDHLVKGTLTIEGLLNFTGNLSVGGVVSGNGSGLTNLNASVLSTGTVPTARLPASALIGDTTYSAGTGLSLSGTTFNVDNPFNPGGTYASLRAQATTKADVGLGSVDNVASSEGSTANTLARRNGNGDIVARLFRSEYDNTNSAIGFIMTQVDTNSNNYIRPSTPGQLKAALNLNKGDVGLSAVPNIDATNASNLASGTVPTARLPTAALIGDTTYSAGTGLNLSGTTFSVVNPFNPAGDYGSLRARGTLKGDVGLGSVRNVASYSQTESDARYLGISAKAADSSLLNGLGSGSFIRSNATDVASGRITFSNSAGLEVPRGITGGYGDSAGTGSNWGASIWGMGDAYNGSGNGVSHAPGSYEVAWLRASHTNANANVGEGLYVFSQGSYRGGLGTAGGHTTGDFKVNGELTATDVIITSDRRVKSELEELDSALEKVLSLTGYTYAMKGLPKGARRMGLIAQDVLEVFPEAVHGSEETSYSLSYGSIIAALVEAIKSQQTQIEEIRDRLTPSHFSR